MCAIFFLSKLFMLLKSSASNVVQMKPVSSLLVLIRAQFTTRFVDYLFIYSNSHANDIKSSSKTCAMQACIHRLIERVSRRTILHNFG
jgi:hypothetical protein